MPLCAALVALAPLTTPPAHAADLADNAALHYWKAVASMRPAGSAEQLRQLEFIAGDLRNLPPRVFVNEPEALRWLLGEKTMLAALSDGAYQAVCAFAVYKPGGVVPDLNHLPALKSLTMHALACAKAYEFADNGPGAASIHANLLRMILHLDQDRTPYSCVAAGELLQLVLRDLEGFVSREQSLQSYESLNRFFRDAPETLLHPGAALRDERVRYTDWLLADPSSAINKLETLYGAARSKPAVERLMALDAKGREQRLREWLKDYGRWVEELAAAAEMPFDRGLPRIQRLDARRVKMAQDAAGGDNPLIPLLVPEFETLYQRFLLAEAQFDVADLLCLIATFRAETGSWPDSLAELRPLLGYRNLPRDPFSSREFYYKNARRGPVLIIRVPRRMADGDQHFYEVDIGRRKEKDDTVAEAAAKQIRRQYGDELNRPVPMQ